MKRVDSLLSYSRTLYGSLKAKLGYGASPTAFNPTAQGMAKKLKRSLTVKQW